MKASKVTHPVRLAKRKLEKKLLPAKDSKIECLEGRIAPATLYVDNFSDLASHITTDNGAPGLDAGDIVTWDPGAASHHGGAVAGLTFGVNVFATITDALGAAAAAGDTIRVGPGVFTESFNVTKQVALLGNQTGYDAVTRDPLVSTADETILHGALSGSLHNTQVTVSTNDVMLDGFLVEGQTNGNVFGAAIYEAPGTHGTEVTNNIIQDNITGVYISNNSTTDQGVVAHNLFRNNTQPGPASGQDIYADQFTAGSVQHVLIDHNTFTNSSYVEDAWAIGISNTGGTAFQDLVIQNNTISNHGRGMYFYNSDTVTIVGNDIGGAGRYAVGIFGLNGTPANANFTITANNFHDDFRGIYVSDDTGAAAITSLPSNTGNTYTNVTTPYDLELYGTQTIGAVDFGSQDVTIIGDAIDFVGGAGSVTGTGKITLVPLTANASIGVNGGAGTLQLDHTDLLALSSSFSQIIIGTAGQAHTISIDTDSTFTLSVPLTLNADGVGGSIHIADSNPGNGTTPLQVSGGLTIHGSGSTTVLATSIFTAGTPIIILDSVQLAGSLIYLDTTLSGVVAAGANVTITGSINADAAVNARDLQMIGGSTGTVTVGGAIGDTARPDNLTVLGLGLSTASTLALDGNLAITLTSALTQSAAWTVVGTTTLSTGAANDITLNNAGNDFSSVGITTGKNVALKDVNALTVNASTISGTLGVTAAGITVAGALSVADDATLASSAGVTFNNSVTMAVNKSLTVTATGTSTGTINLAAASADLATSGTGTISLTTAKNIVVSSGASVTTVDGALTLSANAAGTTSGDFIGISFNGGVAQSTGIGAVSVTGHGGDGSVGVQTGVDLANGGQILANSGTITVVGTGGNTSVNDSDGVNIDALGGASKIASTSGTVNITGTLGVGAGIGRGVSVIKGGLITSGSGNVFVLGQAGAGSSPDATVHISQGGSTISSTSGNVQITAISTGATPTDSDFFMTNATVSAGGTITVISDSMNFATGPVSINAGSNTVTFRPSTTGVAIDLGSTASNPNGPLSLSDTELDFVTAGTVQIGDSNSGAITVSAGISHANHLSLTTSGGVTGAGALGLAAGKNLTIVSNGDVNLTGAVTVSGTTSITPGATHSVTLTNTGNDFATVTVPSATSVSLLDNTGFALGAIGVSTGLTVQSSGTITQSGLVSGAGTLTKVGTGTLVFSLVNTFAGGTFIQDGTLQLTGGADRLVTTSAVTMGGGAGTAPIFDLNGQNQTISALTLGTGSASGAIASTVTTGAGILTVNGSITTANTNITNAHTISGNLSLGGAIRTITVVDAATTPDLTISAVISNGGVIKSGGGNLSFTGANTYASSTTVNQGTLTINGDSALGTAPGAATPGHLTLNGGTLVVSATTTLNANRGLALGASGGTINVNASQTVTYNGIAAGAGVLTKGLAGTLVLGGTNTYTGGTAINAGTLSVSSDANLGTAPGAATPGQISISGGTLVTTASFTLNSNRGIALGVSGGTFNPASGTTLTYGGIVAGSGSLSKGDVGTVVLSGANTYTGVTNVNTGVLNIQNATALGATSSGTIVSSGAALQLQGGIAVAGEPITLNGQGISSDGALRSISGANSWSGAITANPASGFVRIFVDANTLSISGNIALGGVAADALVLGGNGDGTVSGIISGLGGLTKSATGTGKWTLTNANTYGGATNVSAGVLNIQNAAALGGTTSGTTVVSGAALEIQGGIAVGAEALTLSGTGVSNNGAVRNISGTNSWAGAVTLNANTEIQSDAGTLTFDVASGNAFAGAFNLTFDGAGNTTVNDPIATSTGSVTKTGAGTLIFSSSANTYSGGTTLTTGTLQLGAGSVGTENAGALGSGSVSIASGTTLFLNPGSTATVYNIPNSFTVNGTIRGEDGVQHLATGAGATFAVGASGATVQASWSGKDVYIDGIISGTAGLTLNHGPTAGQASAIHITNSANTYSGTVSVGSGNGITLSLDNGSALASAVVNLAGGTTPTLLLTATGNSTLAGLSGSVGTVKPTNAAGSYNLVVNNSAPFTFGGTMVNNTGVLSLTKSGTGTLTLTGANTYTGGTTINASSGTLNATVTATQSGISTGSVAVGTGSTMLLNNTNTSASTVTIGNAFTGAGLVKLSLAAGATVRDTVINGFSGFTGTIQISNAGSTGDKAHMDTASTTAALLVDSGSQLFVGTGGNATFGSINVQGTGNNENLGAIRVGGTLNGPITLAADTTIGPDGGTITGTITSGAAGTQTLTLGTAATTGNATLSGIIGGGTGTIALVKAGTVTVTLSGVNTYTGGTTIGAGFLRVSTSDAALGTGGVTFTGNATLATASGGGARDLANGVTVNSGVTASLDGGFATLTLSGNVTGAGNVAQVSSGTVVLAGTNSYNGTTSVQSGGTLQIGKGGTTGTLGAGNVTDNGTLTFNRTNASTVGNVITGTGALTQAGTGSTNLTATNGYTGATTVNAGTLFVNGSIDSTVTVNNTGTLGGSGTVTSTHSVTVNSGGKLAPGNSPGIINTGNLVLTSGSTFVAEVNGSTPGTGYDQVNVTGTVDLGGATLNTTGTITSSPGQEIVLINNDGTDAVTGTFAGLPEGSTVTINGVNFLISYAGGAGGNDVTLTQTGATTFTSDGLGAGNLTLRQVGSNIQFLDDGVIVDARPVSTLPSITVTGSNADETLTLDYTAAFFAMPVNFNGGGQTTGDKLVINDAPGTATTITHTFTNANDGNVNIDGTVITYTGLEPVTDNMDAVNRVFTFNGGTETITLTDAAGANMTIDSTLGEVTTFANPTGTLTINAGSGDDTITITSMDAGYHQTLTIDGGIGTDSVTLGAGLPSLSALTITTDSIAALPGLTIGAGGFNLTSTSSDITQTGVITVSGATVFDVGATHDITLNTAGNDFSSVGITSGHNILLTDTNALVLAASTVSGTLGVTTNGTLTQSGVLSITGAATFAAGAANDITLNNANNDFSSVSITSGHDVLLNDVNALTLSSATVSSTLGVTAGGILTIGGTVTATSTVSLTASGNLVLGGDVTGSAITATSTAGDIVHTAGTLSAGGVTLSAVAGSIGSAVSNVLTSTNGLATTSSGNQFITEANGLGFIDLNAGTSDIVLTLTAGALADTDAATDVTADDFTVSATSTIGAIANPIQTNVNTITASTPASNIFFDEANGLTGLNVSTTQGVTINVLAGSILDSDAAVDVQGGAVILRANAGSIGSGTGAGAAIQTTATALTGTTTGGGNQFFLETDNVTLSGMNAGTGAINLQLLTGAVIDTVLNSVTADALTITAPGGVGAGGNPLNITVNSLTISTTNSDVIVQEVNGLTALNINAGAGNVTLGTTAGSITDTDGGTDVTAGALTITAPGGIGSALNHLQTAVDSLSSSTTNTDQFFTEANSVALNLLSAGAGNITLDATGAITDNNGAANNIAAATLSLTATTGIGAADALETTVSSLTASNVTGNIQIKNTGALTINGANVTGASGSITIDAASPITIAANESAPGNINHTAGEISDSPTFADDLTLNAGISITSTGASVTLQAGDDIVTGAGSTISAAATVTLTAALGDLDSHGGITHGGTITSGTGAALSARDAIALGGDVSATTGTINVLSSAGSITHSAGTLTAPTVSLSAVAGSIGAAGAEVLTTTGTLTTASSGDQYVTESNGANVSGSSTAGSIHFTSTTGDWTIVGPGITAAVDVFMTATAGAILDNGAAGNTTIDITANHVTLQASTGIGQVGGNLDLDVSTVTSAISNTGGVRLDLQDTNNSGVTVTLVTATTSGSVNLTGTLGSAVRHIGAVTATSGNISISAAAGDIDLTGNHTASGTITETATSGNITHAGGTLTAPTVTLSASGGIGATGADVLTSTNSLTTTSGGDQYITEANGLTAINLNAGANDIYLTLTAGAIADTDGAVDVVARGLVALAQGAIGTLANPIQTTISNIEANSQTGGVFINETDALTIGGISIQTGVYAGGANIAINSGALTIAEDINTTFNVALNSTGTITETTGAVKNAALLTTDSAGGQTLNGTNTVASFDADNLTSGNISLQNAIGNLTIVKIANLVGAATVTNAGGVQLGDGSNQNISVSSIATITAAAGGAMTDGNGATNNITGVAAVLSASAGIGTSANPIETNINNLEAAGGTGGVFVTEADGLFIGGITAMNGVSATAGNIEIDSGNLSITEQISTPATVDLDVIGSITEFGSGLVNAGVLNTNSTNGQTLNGPNTVNAFTAVNTGAGTGISLQNTANNFNIQAVTNQTGGTIFINNDGTDATISGVIKSGNPALGGDITIQTDGLLTVNATVDSSGGSGGTLTLGGLLTLNASPIVGLGDITLQGGDGPLTINAPISVASPLVLQSTEDVNILAKVETTSLTADITVLADMDNNGTGGVLVSDNVFIGSLKAGRNLDLRGSEYQGSFDAGLANLDNGVIIDDNGSSPRLEATGNVFVKINNGAPATAQIWLGGLVRSNASGDVQFDSAILVTSDNAKALTHGAGDVIFFSTIDSGTGGPFNLRAATDVGVVLFNGEVGGVAPMDDVTVETASDVIVNAALTAGSFSVGNASGTVEIHGDLTTTDSGLNLSINAVSLVTMAAIDMTGGTGNGLLQVNNIDLGGDVSGDGVLTIQPRDTARSIGVNAAGDLNLDDTEIDHLQNGFQQIIIGRADGSGLITVGPRIAPDFWHDPVVFRSQAAGGQIKLTGQIYADDDGGFTFLAPTMTVNTPGLPSISAGTGDVNFGSLTYATAVTLLSNLDIETIGGDVLQVGTVNGDFALTIDAGTGAVNLNGALSPTPTGTSIGGITALDSISISGGAIQLRPNVQTEGDQTYTGTTIQIFSGAYTATMAGNIAFNGAMTLSNSVGVFTHGGDIDFNGTIDNIADPSTPAGKGALTVNAQTGAITFTGNVGALEALKSVDINGASALTVNDDFSVFGSFKVKADEVDLLGGINSVHVDGAVEFHPASSNVQIEIGGSETATPNSLSLSDDDIAALEDGATSVTISQPAPGQPITVVGPVTFHDPTSIFTNAKTGGNVTVNGDITADTADGGVTLKGLNVFLNADITTIGGGSIDISNGVIAGATILDTSAGDGNVTLRDKFLAIGAGHDLTISTGAGNINILTRLGAVAGVLGDVTLTSSGDTVIKTGGYMDSLTVDGGGTTFLGGRVQTSGVGGQDYVDAVILTSGVSLVSTHAAGVIHFEDTVNSDAGKLRNFAITNHAALAGTEVVTFDAGSDIGLALPLGASRLGTLNIQTRGDATFGGDINAGSVTVKAGNFVVQNVTVQKNLLLNGDGDFNGVLTADKLTIRSTGDIDNGGTAWVATTSATLYSLAGDITATGANVFGTLALTGNDATVEQAGNMNLGAVRLQGTLDVTTTAGGNLTQLSTQRVLAAKLEGTIAGSIALGHVRNTFTQIGDATVGLTAGGPIEIWSARPRATILDGTISTTVGDITLVADPNGKVGYFQTGPDLALDPAGRWVVFSSYNMVPAYNIDLEASLGPDTVIENQNHPYVGVLPAGNLLIYKVRVGRQ